MPPPATISVSEKIVPDAFHGTSKDGADSILKNNYAVTRGWYLHLGDGAYFYEGCANSAEWWARHEKKFTPPYVLQSTIALGRCIDLNNREHKTILRNFAVDLRQRMQSSPKLREKIPKVCDGVVINLAANAANADTVRAAYTETGTDRIFDGSIFTWASRLVIAVRNTDKISNTKIILPTS